MSSAAKPVVLSSADWSPTAIKFMPPKVNERGGKSINIISKQTNRSLLISTPMMMTWGIADFIGDNGESDGKFSISLNFPNDEYKKPATDKFLQQLKDLENYVLDSAVANSELWWGEEMSREVCKHTFFPFLKFSKNKDTKKIDLTKPPSIRAKVPFYDGKWNVELYDTKENLIFPCDNQNLTPVDFVPKLSQVACVLQCGGIWIGGKGWGLTWKLVQCVVKPREVVSVYGKCHIQLSSEERDAIDSQKIRDDASVDEETEEQDVAPSKPTIDTAAEDSDEEQEVAPAPAPTKKVVKKAAPAVVADAPVASAAVASAAVASAAVASAVEEPVVLASASVEPAKKKVVKKKVVA
jgi:hypothetical protein